MGTETPRRYRLNRELRPEPLVYAADCQRAMKDAIAERSHAFLAAADAGHSMRAISEAVGLTPSAVHKVVVGAERLRDGGYIYVPARLNAGREAEATSTRRGTGSSAC